MTSEGATACDTTLDPTRAPTTPPTASGTVTTPPPSWIPQGQASMLPANL